ncbi:MAG TPA: chemotaxis response regulator protein-glutamate methylesterase, partial [bacterium]|nr:chemotaxis response regulator protein-glutamate methylesterase [bacterium]
ILMAPSKPNAIRVLVVDDSYFMRKMLQEMLEGSNGVVVVLDTAKNGLEAVEKTLKLKPDVITLDVEMPKMDGLQALEKIMAERPTPVVMLSSHTGEGTATTIRAMELGAVDCLAKPAGRVMENMKEIQDELIEKIKTASAIRPRQRPGVSAGPKASADVVEIKEPPKVSPFPQVEKPANFIVAIASSTGGPRALNELFSRLNRNPSTAFVIVQHISVGFTKALARRLGEVSCLAISEAEDQETFLGGHAYVAPAGNHLVVEGSPGHFKAAFSDAPPRLGVKPSADIMMASVAKVAAKRCLGVVLTGMGRDGTEGLKAIRTTGGKTFAQDADSCVVYGMPKSVVEAGLVDRQLTLAKMAEEINALLISRRD